MEITSKDPPSYLLLVQISKSENSSVYFDFNNEGEALSSLII